MGRPSAYSEELADEIAERMAKGDSLAKIALDDNMPGLRTMIRWANERQDFGAIYAGAREAQAEQMDEMILAEAEKTTPENAAAMRVKIDTYKWRAARLNPRRFGDATTLKHADAEGEKLQLDDTAKLTRLASIADALRKQADASDDPE